ncbi:MAG: IS66 family transposase [Candidatus Dormibacteria bacterium]
MIYELRSQLADYGVPKGAVRSFERAIRSEVADELRRMVDAAERRAMAASDEAMQWRLKHNAQQEKAQKFELHIAIADEKLKRAQKAVVNISAYCRKLRHQIFGDKSERGASQSSNPPPANPASPEATAPKRGKKPGTPGYGRKRDATDPQPVNHDLEDADKFCRCGEEFELTDLPPVTSYETHFEERVVVREHIRRKCVRYCNKCGRPAGVKTAKAPDKIIPKGKYSVEFWRYLLEEKFWLQRPLNRTREKLKWLGATVRLGTITNGLRLFHKHRIFEVVYEHILDRSRLAELRNMDDTGWKMFAETAEKHSSRWCMWVSITCDTTVFILDPRRSNEVIAEHLQGVSEGVIVCDRHSSFKCFAKNNQNFIIAFCWVHQRRDFINLQIGHPKHYQWAETWLARIDALIAQNKVRLAAIDQPEQFKIEDSILRKMVDEMKKAIDAGLAGSSLSQEQLAELESLRTHWSGLTVFVDRPYVPMTNNEAERALRDAVLGRKSYYGSRALWSGYQTSWLFTIYATLEQHCIDPHQWMGEYLHACAKNNGLPLPDKELQRFLPWNYKSTTNAAPPKEPSPPPTHAPGADLDALPITVSLMPEQVSHQPQAPPSALSPA